MIRTKSHFGFLMSLFNGQHSTGYLSEGAWRVYMQKLAEISAELSGKDLRESLTRKRRRAIIIPQKSFSKGKKRK